MYEAGLYEFNEYSEFNRMRLLRNDDYFVSLFYIRI